MDDATCTPEVVALTFVDRINHADVDGLAALMTDDHELRIFDEAPVRGRKAVVEGWQGYARAFPLYQIVVRRVSVNGDRVAILGHTTGSHLGLPDEEEAQLTVIWIARIDTGRVAGWTLVEDTAESRRALNLDR